MQENNIVDIGVKKLRNFGFTNVTKDNILHDEVYFFFFKRFITIMQGKDEKLDMQINELLKISVKNNETSKT